MSTTTIPTQDTASTTVTNSQVETPVVSTLNHHHIQEDLSTMLNYASHRGLSIPNSIKLTQNKNDDDLIDEYNTLIKAVEPATVQSIRYIQNHILGGDGENKKWYNIPIISKCLFIAGIALIGLITISLSPSVNNKNQAAGLLASHGLVLFYNLVFICSASLLGVMFYLLKTISEKIKNYTLLPVDAIEVNATVLIGVISGFIIAELFAFEPSTLGPSIETQKMTLALLGGFSSDAIFSVLKGIVNKVKALFSVNGEN